MSDGPKKNPDNLNTIGIITVGLVGAALVYLSIVGLQAFYVDETAIVDEVRSFGDQEKVRTSLKAEQSGHISDFVRKGNAADGRPVVSIGIDQAKKLVVEGAKVDPSNLVPIVGRSDKGTIQPIFGRPVALPPPPTDAVPPPADGSVPGAVPPDGAGAGAGTGTAAPAAAPGAAPGTAPGAAPATAPGTAPGTGATPGQPNPGTGTPTSPAPAVAPTAGSATPPPATPPPATPPPAPAPAHGGGH
ncbi:MAG TPA: hypothetical protein VM261_19185 [Kofleriaceae bacterium]|nr:hypothetical protein [Kofleriaceae bacterium]